MTLEEALLQYGELVKLHGPYSDEAEAFLQKEARLNPDVLWNELFEYSMIVRLIHKLYHSEPKPTFTSTVNQLDQQTATAPQYGNQHERGCTFLGQYTGDVNANSYDLWYGPDHGHGEPTLIARWSPDGPDYNSGLCFGWIEDMPESALVEARRRAEARGLDVRRDYYAGKMKRHPDGLYFHTQETTLSHVSYIDHRAILSQRVINDNLVTTFTSAFFCDGSKMHDGGTLICPPVTGTQREQYQGEDLLSETVTRFSTLFWDRGELTVGAYPAT